MKVPITCSKCIQEYGFPISNIKSADINDDGLYEYECEKGHKTITIVQNEKFEILFDMAASALLDGYKQEAVACMTSAIERFHEWCIFVLLRESKIDFSEIEETWKKVGSQSQRQLGAFYFLFLQRFHKPPIGLAQKQVEFRNKVIHKGHIPTYDRVVEYGEYALNYIRSILGELKINCKESIKDLTFYKIINLQEKYVNKGMIVNTSTSCQPSLLGLYYSNEKLKNQTFKEALVYVKKTNEVIDLYIRQTTERSANNFTDGNNKSL